MQSTQSLINKKSCYPQARLKRPGLRNSKGNAAMYNMTLLNDAEIIYTDGALLKKNTDYYLRGLRENKDSVSMRQAVDRDGYYCAEITHFTEQEAFHSLLIDDNYFGGIKLEAVQGKHVLRTDPFRLEKGIHKITLLRGWGELTFHSMKLVLYQGRIREHNPSFVLSNPGASGEARALMEYFHSIYGKKIITGQHTDINCADVDYIERTTGKLPALLGFDMMSYSAATRTADPTWECMSEISCCNNNVDAALRWAVERKALITLCWHWYSPSKGRDKSFYTVNTEYNLEQALREKGRDYELLLQDMDLIAAQLKRFREKRIPVLWRPLHEADGKWFWWGASGAEAYKTLYRTMYERFTHMHGLDNLIWVVNSPCEGWYPGDDVVDLNCMDIYGPAGNTGPLLMEYGRGIRIPTADKPIGLGEIGTLPDLENMMKHAGWLWFMLWGTFPHEEAYNTKESLIRNFNSDRAVCLDDILKKPIY